MNCKRQSERGFKHELRLQGNRPNHWTHPGTTRDVTGSSSGLAGVARSHLAMIENGSKNANVETLWRIAAALDMRMSELMRMVEDEIPQENHLTKP